MKLRSVLAAVLAMSAPAAHASDQVSVGAAGAAIVQLRGAGFEPSTARANAVTLINWLYRSGNASDGAMVRALVAIVSMMRDGVISAEPMAQLCEVAKNCIENLAIGGGMSVEEATGIIAQETWVAENGLSKMFAVARNQTMTMREGSSLVAQAHRLLEDEERY